MNVSPVKQFALDDTDPFQRVMTSTPDGVIAIGSHGKVHVGCVNSKEFRVLDGFNSTVNRIALNANGTRVGVCAGPEAIVWDIKSGKEVARHKLPTKQYWYEGIQFRADDESAYLLTHYDGVLLDWNFAKNEVNPVFNLANSQTFPEEWRGRVIHASGLLVKNDTTALIFRAPGIVEYNLKTNTERFIKFNKPLSVAALAISPDQKSIAVNTGNTLISIYDFETWQLKFTFAFPAIHENKESPSFEQVAYTHDGKYLVAVGSTGAVRPSYVGVFKATNGDFIGAFQSHEKHAKSLIMTPDDKFIVTAGRDGAKFWQLDDILRKFDKK